MARIVASYSILANVSTETGLLCMLFVFKVAGVFYPFDFVLEGALGLQGEIITERPGLG